MSKLIVEVCAIEAVQPHPNADRLELVVVKGFQSVVGKGTHAPGQNVVYIPYDTIVPQELSDKYGFTKYLDKGRVKATKLRGEPTYGVIIPNEKGHPVGTDVAEELGLTKYIPQVRRVGASGSGGCDDEESPHPLFPKYTELENLRHYPNSIRDGEMVTVSEKIHGCVRKDMKVLLDGGVEVPIYQVHPGDRVVTYDVDNREFTTAEINAVLWQKKTDQLDWYELEFDNGRKLICTADHPVLTQRGWVRTDEVTEADDVLSHGA